MRIVRGMHVRGVHEDHRRHQVGLGAQRRGSQGERKVRVGGSQREVVRVHLRRTSNGKRIGQGIGKVETGARKESGARPRPHLPSRAPRRRGGRIKLSLPVHRRGRRVTRTKERPLKERARGCPDRAGRFKVLGVRRPSKGEGAVGCSKVRIKVGRGPTGVGRQLLRGAPRFLTVHRRAASPSRPRRRRGQPAVVVGDRIGGIGSNSKPEGARRTLREDSRAVQTPQRMRFGNHRPPLHQRTNESFGLRIQPNAKILPTERRRS